MSTDRESVPSGAPSERAYRWPRRTSKKFATLLMLIRGLCVSHLDVLDSARTYRGAAVVLALKQAGFPICTELRAHRTAGGTQTRIAYYWIPATRRPHIIADADRNGVQL